MHELKQIIENAFDQSDLLQSNTLPLVRETVNTVLQQLDAGQVRVAEKVTSEWHVNEWIKKTILLYFKLNPSRVINCRGSGDRPRAVRPSRDELLDGFGDVGVCTNRCGFVDGGDVT